MTANVAERLWHLRRRDRPAYDRFIAECTPAELDVIEADLAELEVRPEPWKPLPHQIPPDSDWFLWMLSGGRGIGKTDALSGWAKDHIEGPPCDRRVPGGHRLVAVSPTIGDAMSALGTGPSSILAHLPGAKLKSGVVGGVGGSYIIAPNGAQIRLLGAYYPEDVERLRAAGNTCAALCDELATWRQQDSWDQLLAGLRLGKDPRAVAATTPKRQKLFRDLLVEPDTVVTRATTKDNPYLPKHIRDRLYRKYGGTRFGLQELEGQLLEDVEGALWTWAWIAEAQGHGLPGRLVRVVVGVDPSGSEDGDEMGIVAVGVDEYGVLWILEDGSLRGSPAERYRAVVELAMRHHAGTIAYEHAYGGDNIRAGIEQAWKDYGRGIAPRYVKASAAGGKAGRAEPVAALYEQQANGEGVKVRHLPGLDLMEGQMTQWEPESNWSPDRLDAMVHAVRHIKARDFAVVMTAPPDEKVRGARTDTRLPAWGRAAG
ncbi:MAG: terminase large subunit domain-containing protein [Nocardioidaceae bacterium]